MVTLTNKIFTKNPPNIGNTYKYLLLTVQRPNFITDIIPLQTFHLTSVEDYATILDLT